MSVAYKILGSTANALTEVLLYTVPALTETKLRISVVNRDSVAATFRVALLSGGGATANEDYVAYDEAVGANESLSSEDFTLAAGDTVRVESSTTTVTFLAYGAEKT